MKDINKFVKTVADSPMPGTKDTQIIKIYATCSVKNMTMPGHANCWAYPIYSSLSKSSTNVGEISYID